MGANYNHNKSNLNNNKSFTTTFTAITTSDQRHMHRGANEGEVHKGCKLHVESKVVFPNANIANVATTFTATITNRRHLRFVDKERTVQSNGGMQMVKEKVL